MIGVPACLRGEEGAHVHGVGEKYVDAVVLGAGGLPVLIPAIGKDLAIDALLERLDGLMLTGSPSNVEPHNYSGPPPPDGSPADPARDATTLPLIRRAIVQGVPLFAICRGHQELNVAMGGSLYQALHEVAGREDHRSDKTKPRAERYAPAHEVTLAKGGLLQGLLGVPRITVNSLHAQAIDRLAPGLAVEATADDGTIEAVRVEGAEAFALGLQWHPEWGVLDNPVSRRLFAAFGAACRKRLAERMRDQRARELA